MSIMLLSKTITLGHTMTTQLGRIGHRNRQWVISRIEQRCSRSNPYFSIFQKTHSQNVKSTNWTFLTKNFIKKTIKINQKNEYQREKKINWEFHHQGIRVHRTFSMLGLSELAIWGQFIKTVRWTLKKVKLLHEDPRNNQPGND